MSLFQGLDKFLIVHLVPFWIFFKNILYYLVDSGSFPGPQSSCPFAQPFLPQQQGCSCPPVDMASTYPLLCADCIPKDMRYTVDLTLNHNSSDSRVGICMQGSRARATSTTTAGTCWYCLLFSCTEETQGLENNRMLTRHVSSGLAHSLNIGLCNPRAAHMGKQWAKRRKANGP